MISNQSKRSGDPAVRQGGYEIVPYCQTFPLTDPRCSRIRGETFPPSLSVLIPLGDSEKG